MRIDFTDRVLDALEDAPPAVRKAFRKQLRFWRISTIPPSEPRNTTKPATSGKPA
jgi:hypothetical protein